MAHAYDNFDDAYNAYKWYWETGKSSVGSLLVALNLAGTAYAGGNDHLAIYSLIGGGWNIYWALYYFVQGGSFNYNNSRFVETIYWANKDVPSAGVDMDAILSAMATAETEQVTYFVGLVDAYRQSIWNKPFNAEFFAALARGFEDWE